MIFRGEKYRKNKTINFDVAKTRVSCKVKHWTFFECNKMGLSEESQRT